MNIRRFTAGLAAVAIAPALAFGAATAAQASGQVDIIVLPAQQYNPDNPNPPLVVNEPLSITVTGCVKSDKQPVEIKAELPGAAVKVSAYNAAGGWGTTRDGQSAYTANATDVTKDGDLKVTITCMGEYGEPITTSETFYVNPFGTEPQPAKTPAKDKPAKDQPAKDQPGKPALPNTGN